MQKVRVPINSFQFGEISDTTIMRTDSAVYAASAQTLTNLLVKVDGGVTKRPALKHVYSYDDIVYDASNLGRSHLMKFVFSDDEQYIVSVEDGKLRIFFLELDGSITLATTLTQDIDSQPLPFQDEYLREYTYAQYGDVMFICHPLFMPRLITRTGLTSFEVSTFTFDTLSTGLQTYQPYTAFHGQGITIDPSATTGSITVTASESYFEANHVGTRLRYGETEILITGYTSPTVVSGTVQGTLRIRLSVLNPLRTIDGSATIEITHISHGFVGGETIIVEDASAVGGINANSINGTRTVGTIIDENTYTIIASASANTSEDGGGLVKIVTHAPTTQWDEQAFSAVRGYPAAVAFHENRLVLAGTIYQPDALWFSKIGQFFNFDLGDANDADAINLVAATGDVNTIRYLVSSRDLQIFTDAAELYVPTYLNQAITPTNAQIRKQTPYGCEFTFPHSFDGATLFIQTGGKVVREYLYTDTEDAYTSSSVSTIASHLIYDPRCLAVSQGAFNQAESYAMLSNGSGDIACFSSNRTEKRAAWTRFETDGQVFSIIGIQDRLFANIWDSSNRMYLAEFNGDCGLDKWIGAKLYDSQHLNLDDVFEVGETISVLAQNDTTGEYTYLGEFDVTSDAPYATVVDLSGYYEAGVTYYAGRFFTVEIKTNPIDGTLSNGPATGEIRGVSAAVVQFQNTKSARVNNRPLVTETNFTGKKEFRLTGHNRDPQITITQDEPLPFEVSGLIAELVV